MRIVFFFLILTLFCVACAGDDDSSSEATVEVDDDSAEDDDSADDDQTDDDVDDDANDDADDDESSPYDDMIPSGKMLGEILAIASHMSTGADYDRDREFEIEQSSAAGIEYVRRGFYWPSIEPEDGIWTFDGYDEMVGLLRGANLKPCAMLTRGVGWAMENDSPSDIDPDIFADFCGAVASRYADDIDLYEIWNEQNTERFWNLGPDPEHYGHLLKSAYEAIHAEDPAAQVVFGGLSALDENLFDSRGIWNFLARVGEYHADLCNFIDGVAIHPYTFLQQPGPEFSVDLGIYRFPDMRGTVDDLRGMLGDLGCAEKAIHFTEIGWPSLLIGPERQAAYNVRGILLALSARVDTYFYYTFYDETPDSDIPTEDYFGLFNLPDGVTDPEPKPAWDAMTALEEMAGDFYYAGDLGAQLDWEDQYALALADDSGAWLLALWSLTWNLDSESIVDVPLHPDATGALEIFDQFGNLIESRSISRGQKSTQLAVSGKVRYLRMSLAAE